MAATQADITSQLAQNDTNSLLASILLELRTLNIMFAVANGIREETADIRGALTLTDFNNQSS